MQIVLHSQKLTLRILYHALIKFTLLLFVWNWFHLSNQSHQTWLILHKNNNKSNYGNNPAYEYNKKLILEPISIKVLPPRTESLRSFINLCIIMDYVVIHISLFSVSVLILYQKINLIFTYNLFHIKIYEFTHLNLEISLLSKMGIRVFDVNN